MRKNVLIVGVPRSGTSMTAHIFASQGYFAAKAPETELLKGDEFNPMGYWEAKSLIEANVELFKAVGYAHHNTWMFKPIADEQAARIASVERIHKHKELVASYNANSPWVWKDPRLCYTLGYWWPLMNPESTAVLLLTRSIEHIFKSFLRVGWRSDAADLGEVAERVSAHMAAAERAIHHFNIPHLKVAYEDFASRSSETARRISDVFGLDICARDVGFDGNLDHSSARGRLIAHVERLALSLPDGWRAFLKKRVPRRALSWLFRGRWR